MNDDVLTCRGLVPSCPGCGESQRIEPLRRVGSTWYLRCLVCHVGIRMRVSEFIAFQERRRGVERRHTLRGGLRTSDHLINQHCPHCNGPLTGWLITPEATWSRCAACGRLNPLHHQVISGAA
jgi:uncharacterized Zn finger protein